MENLVISQVSDTIFNLDNELYHRGSPYNEYCSSTQLKDYLISPKFAKYKSEHPLEFEISKEASEKGSLYHDCMASIVNTGDTKEFEDSVVVFNPPINPATGNPFGYDSKKYKDALSLFVEENPDKRLVSQSDLNLAHTMINEALNNCRETSHSIRQIVKWGKAEVSHFLEYQGVKFKYRPDIETKKKITDWKTVAVDDLHEDTINKIILKFKYDISAAFYQFFEHERTGIWKEFYWIFQQKNAPFDVVLVSAEEYAYSYNEKDDIVKMGPGALKFQALLEQHIYSVKTQVYDGAQVFIQPGFQKRRIMTPTPPGYEKQKLITYYNE